MIDDSADPVSVSTNFNYTTVVTNVSAATLNSVSAVITLHSSLTFVSGSGTGWTVGAVGQVVTCTRATLAVGAAPTITVTVTSGASPTTAVTTADASATGVPNANQDSESTTIQSVNTTLTVTLAESADPVNVSTNFSYTSVVTNTGANAATSVSAVITLDASLTFVSGSGTGWSVSALAGVVTCTRATLAVGAAPTLTITVTAGASALTATSEADASAANAAAAPQATETTRIRATTTLTVAIDDSADPVNISTNYSYTTTVTNTGSATAETASAVIALDASLTFVSGSGTGWTVNNVSGTVTCTRATLAVGAAPVITITVTAGASPLTASTTANASAANAAAATQDTETTVIRGTTTLSLALTDSTDPVITAVNFTYAFIVTNSGAVSAANVTSAVVLDASLTFVSGSGTGWTVNNVSGTVTCTRATLAVGAAPTVTITVTSGGSALTASSTSSASADNAAAATPATQTTVVKLVSKDATSGIRVPNSSTEWTDFNAYHVAIGTSNYPNVSPASLYLMQEASGNLTDSIGSITLTVTGANWTYQTAVTGWTRKSLSITDGQSNQNAQNTTTAVDIASTSAMLIMFLVMPTATPAAARRFNRINSNGIFALLSTTPRLQCGTSGAGGSTVSGTNNPLNGVRPIVVQADKTGARARVYSDQEEIVGTVGTYSTIALGMGASAGNTANAGYLYSLVFTGAAGEMTKNGLRALLVAMGWSIAW